jgi:hypothetical protein
VCGDVQQVRAFHQPQVVEVQAHLARALEPLGLELLQVRVGAVHVDAVRGEEADAEHEVLDRLRRPHVQRDREALPWREHVPRVVAVVEQPDTRDLHLAAAPAPLAVSVRRLLPRCLGRVVRRLRGRLAVLPGQERLLAARHVREVRVHDALGVALVGLPALAQPQHVVAHLLHEAQAVRHQHDGLAAPSELADLVEALAGEGLVTHRQHLVDQQDVRVDVDGHREAQARVHARRVGLDGRVDEALQLGEGHDVVEALLHLPAGETQHDPVDGDVLAPADLGMEAGAQLDEGRDAAAHHQAAARGPRDAGHQLQQRRLAGAVLADHAERGAGRDLEGHAVHRGEGLARRQVGQQAPGDERALERAELVPVEEAAVDLRHVPCLDGQRRAHTSSASVSRRRSNSHAPTR